MVPAGTIYHTYATQQEARDTLYIIERFAVFNMNTLHA